MGSGQFLGLSSQNRMRLTDVITYSYIMMHVVKEMEEP